MPISQSYVAILFSPELSASEAETKLNAIVGLKDYFEKRPELNTGDETYHPISYAVEPFLKGQKDLSQIFRAKVVHAELNEKECADVRGLGFTTRVVGPSAYNFYRQELSK